MDNEKYFCSITDEIKALQDRLGNYINHQLSLGEWKESVIRTILRRHLPQTVGIGNGFVVAPDKTSTQIDILLYDTTKPLLFHDGDLVIVTPDSVRGMIEVKTTVHNNGKDGLDKMFTKLADNRQMIPYGDLTRHFFGVFGYKSGFKKRVAEEVLNKLYAATRQKKRRIINCVCIGDDLFVRYWDDNPAKHGIMIDTWHAYDLEHKAPAYFVNDVIEQLCPPAQSYNALLYSSPDKIAEKTSGAWAVAGPPHSG